MKHAFKLVEINKIVVMEDWKIHELFMKNNNASLFIVHYDQVVSLVRSIFGMKSIINLLGIWCQQNGSTPNFKN